MSVFLYVFITYHSRLLQQMCNILSAKTRSIARANSIKSEKTVVLIKVFCIFNFSLMYIHKGQLHLTYHISLSKCMHLTSTIVIDS